MALPRSPEDYLARCIKVNDCLVWTGSLHGAKCLMPATSRLGKSIYIHKFLYNELVEPVPKGVHVTRTCKNLLCLNVKHMKLRRYNHGSK